ncbi:outer membrane lipoprotein carrier protein LolA [Cytophagales bacterium LB-30]|uniref:Outer membrane lipoprotein carrier protein LolA n=1 Tax=Shiella aurantiaca TaxID=3058365 RepID=A0ABT8F1U7_9BACT|nr:outer membrane lipoprotein carrier protein LolA [Shiella aurantiaca]MDN4164283.1 outer membrane lipoprotein carrier protein LolA [Shiella aurantiaca]
MMRRITALMAFLLSMNTLLFAQYDPKALGILDAMSAKYKSIPSFSAKFTYTLQNEMEGVNEDFKGEVAVKGDKYRIKMSGQEIMNDGATSWTYLADINEVTIDNYDPNSGDMTPSKIFTAYKKGYKYLYLQDKTEAGQVYEMVDLVPEDKNQQFFRIRMQIHKKDRTLKSWEIYDKVGNIYRYAISDFNPNQALNDAYFRFDTAKYPGVEVIDLR